MEINNINQGEKATHW